MEAWHKEVTRVSIIPKFTGYESKVSSPYNIPNLINFEHSRVRGWQNLHTLLTVFRNYGSMLQNIGIMPALWLMLQVLYYAQTFAGIVRQTLAISKTCSFQLGVVKSKNKAITLANHKGHSQASEPIKTRITWSWSKARENACKWVTIGFGFTSDWIKMWRQYFTLSANREEYFMQNQLLLDTQTKTALSLRFLRFSVRLCWPVWVVFVEVYTSVKSIEEVKVFSGRSRGGGRGASLIW